VVQHKEFLKELKNFWMSGTILSKNAMGSWFLKESCAKGPRALELAIVVASFSGVKNGWKNY